MSQATATALATLPSPFKVVVLSGDQKGVEYELLSSGITIGRSQENDIVLESDLNCSRRHARLSITPAGVEVEDLSQKNKIEVDGKFYDRTVINPGSTFTVGSTRMRLDVINAVAPVTIEQPATGPSLPQKTVPAGFPMPPQAPPGLPPLPQFPSANPPRGQGGAPNANSNRVLLYGMVALILAGIFLIAQGKKKKAEEVSLGGKPEETESRLQEYQRRKELYVKASERDGVRNPQWREAQALYLQGFRDYKKGQYTRAIEAFRGALSIYPNHQMASRYMVLAKRKVDEVVQGNIKRAREYREKSMYQKCSAHFAMAMTLLNDPSSATYKEARSGMEECNLYLEGRY
jgi:hypothetical protein